MVNYGMVPAYLNGPDMMRILCINDCYRRTAAG